MLLLDDVVVVGFEPSFGAGTSSRLPVSSDLGDLGTIAEVRSLVAVIRRETPTNTSRTFHHQAKKLMTLLPSYKDVIDHVNGNGRLSSRSPHPFLWLLWVMRQDSQISFQKRLLLGFLCNLEDF